MGTTRKRRRRIDWLDDAAFDRECRKALTRLISACESEGEAAVERLVKTDPLGFCMAMAVLASEGD